MISYFVPELYNHFQPNGRKSKLIRAHPWGISQQSEPPIDIVVKSSRLAIQRQRIKNGDCSHRKHRDAVIGGLWCRSRDIGIHGVIAVEC